MRTQAHKEHIMRLAHDSIAAGCLAVVVVVVLNVTSSGGT
jgi:ABC-type hemin transport system ATPase subunit